MVVRLFSSLYFLVLQCSEVGVFWGDGIRIFSRRTKGLSKDPATAGEEPTARDQEALSSSVSETSIDGTDADLEAADADYEIAGADDEIADADAETTGADDAETEYCYEQPTSDDSEFFASDEEFPIDEEFSDDGQSDHSDGFVGFSGMRADQNRTADAQADSFNGENHVHFVIEHNSDNSRSHGGHDSFSAHNPSRHISPPDPTAASIEGLGYVGCLRIEHDDLRNELLAKEISVSGGNKTQEECAMLCNPNVSSFQGIHAMQAVLMNGPEKCICYKNALDLGDKWYFVPAPDDIACEAKTCSDGQPCGANKQLGIFSAYRYTLVGCNEEGGIQQFRFWYISTRFLLRRGGEVCFLDTK